MLKWFVSPAKMFILYDNICIYCWKIMSSMLSLQEERTIFLILVSNICRLEQEWRILHPAEDKNCGVLILTWKGAMNLIISLS